MSSLSPSAFHTPSQSTNASFVTSTPSSLPVNVIESKHHVTEQTQSVAHPGMAPSTASSLLPSQHLTLTAVASASAPISSINVGGISSGWIKVPQASPSTSSAHIDPFAFSGSVPTQPPFPFLSSRATSAAATSQHLIQLAHHYINEGALARALLSAIASVHCFSDLAALTTSAIAADSNQLADLYDIAYTMRSACIQLYEEDLKRRTAAFGQPFVGWSPELFIIAKNMAHTNESFYLDLCASLMLSRRQQQSPPQQLMLSPQSFANGALSYAAVTMATLSTPMSASHMTSPVTGFVATPVALHSMPITGDMCARSSSEWDTAVCKYCNRAWEVPDGRDEVSQKRRQHAFKAKRDHEPYCPFNPKREAYLSKRRNQKHNKSEAGRNEHHQSTVTSKSQQTASTVLSSPQQSSEEMRAEDASENEYNLTTSALSDT